MYRAQLEGVKLLTSHLDALCLWNTSSLRVIQIAPKDLDWYVDIVSQYPEKASHCAKMRDSCTLKLLTFLS